MSIVSLAEVIAAYLADARVMVPLELAVGWSRRARADAYEAGHSAGYLEAVAEVKATHRQLARGLAASAPQTPATWLVRCGRHRRGIAGPCGPLGRCERRDRSTFGSAHPDDFTGLDGAA